jgi:adenylosuccinate synthase
MGIQSVDVIVDLQYGDTGKGKVAHHLAKSGFYDIVLRYNGGSNAGHTVYHNGEVIVTHQVPMGVLHGITSIIGLGCVVNISKLIEEIRALNAVGIDTKNLIKIDKRAHVVTEQHLHDDKTDTIIGTTGQGIGPAYRDKYNRTGIPIGKMDMSQYHHLFEVIDIYDYLFIHDDKYNILCEGAQGFHLDIDWGEYPYVTSSHCTVGSVCLNGIPPHKIRKVYGVMKAYETYVGNNKNFTNQDDEVLKTIQLVGQEVGATTGRPRQVNWANLDNVIKAMHINGVTDLIINKVDILREVNKFAVIDDGMIRKFASYHDFNRYISARMYDSNNRGLKITWSQTPDGI